MDCRLISAWLGLPPHATGIAALRSRCMEIFFKPLDNEDIRRIAGAVEKIFEIDDEALNEIIRYAVTAEAVNIAAGRRHLRMDKSNRIVLNTVERC